MPDRSGLVVTAADINALVSALELTQTPSYADLAAPAAFVNLDVVSFAADVTLTARHSDLQAGLGYLALTVTDLKLDPFFLYRVLADSVSLADTVGLAIGFGRAFTEDFTPVDAVSLHAQLVLASAFLLDDMESVDDLAIQTGIRKTNLLFPVDVLTFSLARTLTDGIGFSDLLLITFNISPLDIIVVADTFLLELAFVPSAIVNGAPLNTFALNE